LRKPKKTPIPCSLFPVPCSPFPVLILFLFTSCATAPRVPAPAADEIPPELSMLPAGGRIYLWADTVQSRPLLDILSVDGFSGRDAAMMLDRTGTAAAVVFPEGHDRRFFLAATGRYPRHRANFSFAFSRAWRRQRGYSGRTFWYSRNNNIALSLGPNLSLVSNKDPFEGFEREIPPQSFAEFRRGMALAGWLSNPSDPINDFLETLGLPIQIPAEDFFFGAVRSPQNAGTAPWELAFKIRAPSAADAGSLIALFSMARFFILQMAGGGEPLSADMESISLPQMARLLFANPPEQDGAFLTFRIDALYENTIALLFTMFSVYSNQ